MSEWWRRNAVGAPRIEEEGEVAPAGKLLPMPSAKSEEQRAEELLAQLQGIDAALGNKNVTTKRGHRVSMAEWNASRQRLKQQKAMVLAEYVPLKKRIKERNFLEQTVTPRREHAESAGRDWRRAVALVMGLRTIVAGLDEPSREELELVRAAGEFLRDQGALP